MDSDDPKGAKRRGMAWIVSMACCLGGPASGASEPEAAEEPVVESTGDAYQEMQRLYDLAEKDPESLDDATLARVFVHLMEYPGEVFQAAYLVHALERRDTSKSYELTRALAIYYGSLHGDLFHIGGGRSAIEAHLRAARHLSRAVAMRPEAMDHLIENPVDYDHPNPEVELANRLESIFAIANEAVEWLEFLEEEDGVEYAQTPRAKHFAEVNQAFDRLGSRLERLRFASREITELAEFLEQYLEIWPWD